MSSDPDTRLEALFLETALRRGELLRANESRKANKEFDTLHMLKDRLRGLPDKGEWILKRLAGHDDLDVRILAAAGLLVIDEPYTIGVLEAISAGDSGLPSFSAEMTLREWRKGAIRDYWA